ncbi:MAG: NnrS family protein [Alphaproteobacteria bacterium]|nr:NnrS family protein [Alphaproteobacteria bacterium]
MPTKHIPIPRYKMTVWPMLFTQGFRPFFLLAGLWAPAGLLLSLAMLLGFIDLPIIGAAMSWHAHEMLFGFVAAAVAGFVLTAVPNWTGRLPLQGAPLAILVVLWLAGRLAMAFGDTLGAVLTGAIDAAFLVALIAAVAREIIVGGNWRNLPVVGALTGLATANLLFHAEAAEWIGTDGVPIRLGLAVIAVLVALIGGRIVPSFTRNALAKAKEDKLPAAMGPLDALHLAVTVVAGLIWAAVPEGVITGAALLLAGGLGVLRLLRWRGVRTFGEPLLWSLHLGYLWLVCAQALLGIAVLSDAIPMTAGIHALTAGAFGTMILAVMSRATLGHTGRPLSAGAGLAGAYLLVGCAAALRIAATLTEQATDTLLVLSAASWCAAFLAFLAVCGPMLTRPRPKVETGNAASAAR